MSQKKKTQFKILTPPEDLSEIKHKIWKFQIAKVRKVLVLFVLIFLAVCGTILMLDNQTYTRARTASQYPGGRTGSGNYARFADGIVRYNRDGVVFLDRKNEEQWIQSAQIQNPVISVRDRAFAVADNGGNTILVFTEEGLKGEIETTLPIEKIAVSDQGIVTAVLRNESSPEIISYDAVGNILVEQQAAMGSTGYPVAIEMSDDGNPLSPGLSIIILERQARRKRIISSHPMIMMIQ